MTIAVRFYSELLQKEIMREFENYHDAFRFAATVNGIVIT